ncbi:phage tail tip lysozyme, partial [Gemmobacter nanjingensis]|uniref:phage tail tip lysozyme n=1 Tax=Gemmobacter nanjingensis TaxID=488454 RepID=UPI001E507DA6
AKAQSADMRVELEIRARLNTQVAAGLITAEEANRLLREEIELHPLVAAAAEANGKEQADLNKIIAERRELSAQLAREEKRAQATEALIDYGKAQAEQIARLRLEASLIGATDRERARAIAGFEAEVELRRRSTEITADQIAKARSEAAALADRRAEVERLADAWGSVEASASSAIDGMVDGLLGGDLSDALKSIGQQTIGLISELSLKNPLKNAILGTDLPTMADVGGLSGIFGRLFGGGSAEAAQLSVSTMNASSMSVTTPMVQISAGTISGQLPGGAGGIGYAGGGAGQLAGSTNVQQQVWAFFAAKGLAPHQIAAIMGNVQAESGFNPLAVGDGGAAHGLFQWNDRAPKLFDFIGGQGNLGNVQAQLEFAWREMMTSENGPFQRLMASTNLYDATHAFVGFERPQGYNANNPTSAHGWDQRLAGAEAAMARFEGTTLSTQAQLGQLGTGAA